MSSSKINLGKVALTPKGEWSATATYERLDVVSYQGSSYTVLKTCTGQTPAEGEYYTLLAEKGDDGEQGTELGWLDASSLLVGSFNHRSGHVVPMAGDYTPEMVGASDKNHNHDSVYYKKDQVDSLLQMKIGQNMALNWYLSDPINQQGLNEYEATDAWSYSIDQFKSAGTKVIVEEDCVRIVSIPGVSKWSRVVQLIDHPILPYHTYTFSIYARIQIAENIRFRFCDDKYGYFTLTNGTGIGILKPNDVSNDQNKESYKIYSVTVTPDKYYERFGVEIIVSGTDELGSVGYFDIGIKAIKVELGSKQTLAHKEGSNWVLNDPPPDKALELTKCQRYYERSAINTNQRMQYNGVCWYSPNDEDYIQLDVIVPFVTEKRSRPVCKLIETTIDETIGGMKIPIPSFFVQGIGWLKPTECLTNSRCSTKGFMVRFNIPKSYKITDGMAVIINIHWTADSRL